VRIQTIESKVASYENKILLAAEAAISILLKPKPGHFVLRNVPWLNFFWVEYSRIYRFKKKYTEIFHKSEIAIAFRL
jgi:hypothetical protein